MKHTVTLTRAQENIPTYIPKPPVALPMFFEKKPYQGATGRLYPLPYSDGITDEKKDVSYEVYTLENEYIQTKILPAIGGKILSGYDKVGSYDFIYRNHVIKPALVGLAGAWISGGIEFNWPQHHRPTTFMPVEASAEENADGSKTVWVGEVEPFNRQKGMVGITVEPGRSYIKAKVRVYNRTNQAQLFMWWANLAVSVNNDYRTIFPPDVEWANDHDRRAVISWPIAKGTYHTARPFNYGEGTDLSRYDSVKIPSSFMVSQGQSDMDFLAGYDGGIQKGIATVANHHISPGKKLWTWGHGDFGDMWCSNLTDNDGPYIELMTGVYTDNQPDFTWLAPFESREFEQYWYPVRDIGDVKNASIDACMNFEQRGENAYVGFNVTGSFPNAQITVRDGETVLFTETCDMVPEKTWSRELALNGHEFKNLTAELRSETGKLLVSYTPYVRGQKQPIEPRQPVKRPSEYDSIEELFINGLHLEQYKQHNYDARDYYREALRRDPGDIRCNTAMGRLALKDGKFEDCIAFCDKAIERLTSRNQHPMDTESFYLKGLALQYLGKLDEAYDALYRAAWNNGYAAGAYYQLATIDACRKDYCTALSHLEEALVLNSRNSRAVNLKAAILRKLGRLDEAKALSQRESAHDLLDLWSRVEAGYFTDNTDEIRAMFGEKPENYLDVVCAYMEAGFYEDALHLIDLSGSSYPLLAYYRAFLLHKLSREDEAIEVLTSAAALDTGLCFPSRLEDIAVLRFAIEENAADANACYYLGSLFYDRFRYDEAIMLWEQAITRNDKHAKALRNLALAYFDKRGDAASARVCMEKALANRHDPRLLFEYQQLLKNMNVSVQERLDVYDKYPELLAERDDCYLDRIVLLSQQGRYEEAIHAAKIKHFHIYEGGEGNLTKQHAWMHVLYGNALAAEGKTEAAHKAYLDGIDLPKSYGEAKTWFNQEAHIYFYLGNLLAREGHPDEAAKAYEEASVPKAIVSELSMFRGLALRKLMRFTEAEQVLQEMIDTGTSQIENSDLRAYYGVGAPTPMPFEYDIVKINTVNGHVLRAYGLLGLGHREQALQEIEAAKKLSPNDFRIYAFEQIKDTF